MLNAVSNPVRPAQMLLAASGVFLLAITAYPQTLDSRHADTAKAKAQVQCIVADAKSKVEKH